MELAAKLERVANLLHATGQLKYHLEQFSIHRRKLFVFLLVLHFYALWLVRKTCATSQPISSKPKPIVTCPHAFSRAWRHLHVFASSSDWFIIIALLARLVTKQSHYSRFGFTTVNWKRLQLKFSREKDSGRRPLSWQEWWLLKLVLWPRDKNNQLQLHPTCRRNLADVPNFFLILNPVPCATIPWIPHVSLELSKKSFKSARCAFSNASPSLSKTTSSQCLQPRLQLLLDNQKFNIWFAWTRSRLDSSKRPSWERLNPRSNATGLQLTLNLEESSGTTLLGGNLDLTSGSPVSAVANDSSLENSSSTPLCAIWKGLDIKSRSASLLFVWRSFDISCTLWHDLGPFVSCTGSFGAQCSQFLHGSTKSRGWGTICSVELIWDSSQESLSVKDPQ